MYDTTRIYNVPPLQEINTTDMYMKHQRMVHITKIPGEYDISRQNSDSSLVIYITEVVESECHVVASDHRKQYDVKKNSAWVNAIKKAAHITK